MPPLGPGGVRYGGVQRTRARMQKNMHTPWQPACRGGCSGGMVTSGSCRASRASSSARASYGISFGMSPDGGGGTGELSRQLGREVWAGFQEEARSSSWRTTSRCGARPPPSPAPSQWPTPLALAGWPALSGSSRFSALSSPVCNLPRGQRSGF